ncbi:unnamed protein product [Cochlearia groenlandica]
MPKENILTNNARVSPYPLRSSRTKKHEEHNSFFQSNWEDVQCVICQESPHNAVLLLCTSCPTGCRPYMCDTSARHSNCFKQFRKNNKKKNLKCPLCRGEVFDMTKVISSGRRFMNAKPRSCPFDDCEFVGTYSKLDKHLKTEHSGLVPPKIDPVRQQRWEEMIIYDELVGLMNAYGITNLHEFVQHQLPNTLHPPVLQVNINGVLRNFYVRVRVSENMVPGTTFSVSFLNNG